MVNTSHAPAWRRIYVERQICNDDHLNLGKLNKWQMPVPFGDYFMTMMTFKKFFPESKMTRGRDYETLTVARSCNLGLFFTSSVVILRR